MIIRNFSFNFIVLTNQLWSPHPLTLQLNCKYKTASDQRTMYRTLRAINVILEQLNPPRHETFAIFQSLPNCNYFAIIKVCKYTFIYTTFCLQKFGTVSVLVKQTGTYRTSSVVPCAIINDISIVDTNVTYHYQYRKGLAVYRSSIKSRETVSQCKYRGYRRYHTARTTGQRVHATPQRASLRKVHDRYKITHSKAMSAQRALSKQQSLSRQVYLCK